MAGEEYRLRDSAARADHRSIRPAGLVGWLAVCGYRGGQSSGDLPAAGEEVSRSSDRALEDAARDEILGQAIVPLITIVFPLILWTMAALDARHGWSRVAWPLQLAGFALVVAGIALML